MSLPFGPFGTSNGYTAAASADRFAPAQRINIDVQSNPVYMQYQLGLAGSWAAEEFVRPGTYGRTVPTPYTGVRFRSASAGLPATVSGTVLYE